MKTFEFTQGSQEWLQWRKSGVGASEVSAIVGIDPWKTAINIYDDKAGFGDPTFVNDFMKRGNTYEEEARREVEQMLGLSFPPLCVGHSEMDFAIASLDGYSKERNLILEVKTPGRKVLDMAMQKLIPDHYKLQMQWQMFCSGAEGAYYFAYNPDTAEKYLIEYPRDEKLIARLRTAVTKFWGDYKKGIRPSPQKKDFIQIRDPLFEAVASKYRKEHQTKKDAEEKLKALKDEIVQYGDDGNFEGFGIKAVRVQPKTSYDMDKMKADGIDLSKYQKRNDGIGYYTIRVDNK